MKINLFNENDLLKDLDINQIIHDIELLFNNHFNTNKDVSLIIVTIEEIHKLNNEYRKIDRPTDVLSFEEMDDDYLGEIFICDDKVREQANLYEHSECREFAFLLTHGLLHLLGYDHMNEKDEKEMFDLQNDLLNETIYRR